MKYIWNGNQNGANLSSCPSSSISSPNLQHRNLKFSDNSEINSWNKKSTCSKLEAPSSSLSFSACAPPSMRVWQSFKKSISFPYHILLLSFCSIFLNKVKLKYFIPQLLPKKISPHFYQTFTFTPRMPPLFQRKFPYFHQESISHLFPDFPALVFSNTATWEGGLQRSESQSNEHEDDLDQSRWSRKG